jgi:peroxiredoxin
MRDDFVPGRTFPDFVLPDRTRTSRRLSALQGDDPMLVLLIRSLMCPQDREQLAALTRVRCIGNGCCKLVAITSDATPVAAAEADATNALLHDETQHVRDTLDIAVCTDDGDERPLIPHTFLLAPGLHIRRVWNGRHPWGRPSTSELHDALCELTREVRPARSRGAAVRVAALDHTLNDTLNDMVAAYRDAGLRGAPRSFP